MWIQKISFKVFIFLYLCNLTVHNAFAENNFATRLPHQQINEDIFQLTDVENAIIKLCRDLQINPKNKSAQQNFTEITKHPTLTARQRSQVYLLEDLLKFNKDLKRRVNYLTIKRNFLKDQFIKDALVGNTYLRGLRNIESNLSRSYGTKLYSDHVLFEQSDPLMLVYNILNDQKDQLLVRVEYLQEQYRWLNLIINDQRRHGASVQYDRFSNIEPSGIFFTRGAHSAPTSSENIFEVGIPISSKKNLGNIGKERPPKSNDFGEISPLAESDEGSYVILPRFARQDEGSNIRKNTPTPQIITLAPVKEKDDGDFNRASDSLQTQFSELREDLKQKDLKINDLSKQVVDLMLKMSEIEILLNKKVESTLRLKAELDDANQRFKLGKRIIQEKDEEIQSLQIVRDQLKARSNSNDNVSSSRDEKLMELSGILEIYKYKLTEKNHLAKEKTRALAKTRDDLRFLGDRLTLLESEISEIKKHSEQNGLKSPEMESKVWELQSKFEDIQHFLLENLGDSDKIKFRSQYESFDLSK